VISREQAKSLQLTKCLAIPDFVGHFDGVHVMVRLLTY